MNASASSGQAAEYKTAEYKAARRAVARMHHPDIGGDPVTYMAALAEVDRRFAVRPKNRSVVGSAATSAPPTAFRASSIPTPIRALPKQIARFRKRITRRNYFEL